MVFVYFIDTTDVQVFTAYQNSGKIHFTIKVAINSSIQEFIVNVSSSTGKNVSIPVWRTSDQQQLTNETMVLPVGLYYLTLFARDSSHNYVFTNITMSVNCMVQLLVSYSHFYSITYADFPHSCSYSWWAMNWLWIICDGLWILVCILMLIKKHAKF